MGWIDRSLLWMTFDQAEAMRVRLIAENRDYPTREMDRRISSLVDTMDKAIDELVDGLRSLTRQRKRRAVVPRSR